MYEKLKDLEDNLPLKNQISLFDLKNNTKGEKNMSRFEKALENLNQNINLDKNKILDTENKEIIIESTPSIIDISKVANSTLGNKNDCKEYSTITIRIKNTSLEKLDLLKNASGRSRSYIIDYLIDSFIKNNKL